MEDIVPFMALVLVLAMALGIVLFVSTVQPVKALVASAGRHCARTGIETLAAGRGLDQATATALETAALGSAIDPTGLFVRAYTTNVWGRGQVLVCEAGYNVRVDHLPMVSWFYRRGYVPIRSRVSLDIEPYKSRWGR